MLCLECEKLGLSPERFHFSLDRGCVRRELGRVPLSSVHKLKRQVKQFKGSDCQFCKLVYESVTATSGQQVNDETECLIEWVTAQGHDPVSRRIRISWSLSRGWVEAGLSINIRVAVESRSQFHAFWPVSRMVEAFLSALVTGRYDPARDPKLKEREELYFLHVPSRNMWRSNMDAQLLLDKEAADSLAQNYDEDIYTRINNWINLCKECHRDAHTLIEDEDRASFRDLARKTWFCVVDVEKLKLTHLELDDEGQPEPHVALSYVWGEENNSHETLLSNVMQRKEDGGLILDDLPRTIQDAIQLVKDLGLRFIWVDSLCIPQDSNMSWRVNAENMHLVFGNAYFTICAADGDSSSGLRAMHPETRYVPLKAQIMEDLELLVSKSPESVIQASRWSTRGWAFQERILSRRCLVFAGDGLYLQCRSSNYDNSNMSWSSGWRESPLRTLKDLKKRPIWFYMTCVELYTGRDLTRPEDILKAFNGVSRAIEKHLCAPVLFGLPVSHFDFALLWRPKSGKERRPNVLQKDAEFPSWSWSGWQDAIPQKGATVWYPADVLEGCLQNLNAWLHSHTWIVWYIRDRNGDLEPLWQGYSEKHTERSQEVADRWKGYNSLWDPGIQDKKNDASAYGRKPFQFDHDLPRTEFTRTIPNNPFGVRISRERKRVYQPILQFWTWKCEFYIVLNNDPPGPGAGLDRFDVLNKHGDWCGTVVIDKSWSQTHRDQPCEFIALSDAQKFTDYECTSWTYTIPKNLEDIDWDLYHIMLIDYIPDRHLWERKGLGKVLKAAFEPLEQSKWVEITLG